MGGDGMSGNGMSGNGMGGNGAWRRRAGWRGRRSRERSGQPWVLITGGAGFVGANLADRLLRQGERVRILDDLSRSGVERNARWLRARHDERLRLVVGDVRDAGFVERAVHGASFVFHLAAQVAVTTSLENPREDHSINVLGTLNVLEAIRGARQRPGMMFASTNKVYGTLPGIALRREGLRYVPRDESIRLCGVSEEQPLDFVSPYGCSKGAAEQYVLDYCRSFGLEATVFRMSCIYGPRQQANGDQGWVTHFLRCALLERELTIYGDGCQVRDVLYIDDFVSALLAARQRITELSGSAFNIGGGPAYSLSLLELIEAAETLCGRRIDPSFDAPRLGDQPLFAADHRRFTAATGWRPTVSPQAGLARVWSWLLEDNGAQLRPPAWRGAASP
jgi:CDP-paratose 2-epimerase